MTGYENRTAGPDHFGVLVHPAPIDTSHDPCLSRQNKPPEPW